MPGGSRRAVPRPSPRHALAEAGRQAGDSSDAADRVKGETVTGVAGDPRRGGALVSSGGETREEERRERWW